MVFLKPSPSGCGLGGQLGRPPTSYLLHWAWVLDSWGIDERAYASPASLHAVLACAESENFDKLPQKSKQKRLLFVAKCNCSHIF